MGSIVDIIRSFVGTPPFGYEWLEYGVAVIFLLFLLQFVTDLFRNMSRWFSGR